MNTIRPILTITILGAVAWFLYVQINKGTLRPHAPAAGETAQTLAPALPPLDGDAPKPKSLAAVDSKSSVAPQWPSEPANTNASPRYGTAPTSTPSTPAIPDLPELPPVPEIVPDTVVKPDTGIAAAPGARYGATAQVGDGSAATPPLGSATATPGGSLNANDKTSSNSNFMPQAAGGGTNERDPATENAMAAMGLTGNQAANPAQRSASSPDGMSRYGAPAAGSTTNSSGTAAPAATAPAAGGLPTSPVTGPSFSSAWPPIQAALDRGDLAKAHQMLSPWYGDPSLTPAEAERVDSLLGQLAGSVIYSTEHRLEPPYTVKPGDTLESIARQHEVPSQLLAKINGIASPDQVRPGQQLKVIRGPFGAMVDLRRNQLALSVDGRYAGKFSVSAPAMLDIPSGEWVVADKPATPATSTSVYAASGGSPSSPAVSRAIVLRAAGNNTARPGTIARIAASDAPITPIGATDADQKSTLLLKVSPRDAEELSDILSIGSRVVIQR